MMARGVLAAALLLAGCGGGASAPHVATAQRSAPATAAAGSAASSPSADGDYDKALRYTRCMTEHGVPTPDPVVGVSLGGQTFNRGDTEATVLARRDAFEACKHFLPATWPVKADPKDVARDRPFWECMRQHGMPVEEPDANGMYHEPTDRSPESTPEYLDAVEQCRYLVDDPANHQ
jgi:hypothetical protein